jgi:hypothetical protein
MSLQPQPPGSVPEETARVARAAFPRGNLYMRMRDEFGAIFTDTAFAPSLLPAGDRPKRPGGWRLSPFCSMPKAYPTVRPPKRCGAVSTGSTPWAWSSRLPVLIARR